ncbi:MAG: hypothetical protein JW787_08890 [Sedimentisphaerales bacterium]|nr:hypothetical protein [Sedimentisphaerales bacterium]
MKRLRQTSNDEGPKVPAYIVTFSDMVTLLLTFFVMLLTLADVQDAGLFDRGRDAFIESIRYLGLGMLMGRESAPDLGASKVKYNIDNPDELPDQRTIDAKAEELRRIFEKIKKSSTTVPPEVIAKTNNFSVASKVNFQQGKVDLDDSAKQFLTEFCADLISRKSREPITLYILGLAPEEKSQKSQWIISAMRAEIVAKYIRESLASMLGNQNNSNVFGPGPKCSVYSWGAGSGGEWAAKDSEISNKKHIFIATLTQN